MGIEADVYQARWRWKGIDGDGNGTELPLPVESHYVMQQRRALLLTSDGTGMGMMKGAAKAAGRLRRMGLQLADPNQKGMRHKGRTVTHGRHALLSDRIIVCSVRCHQGTVFKSMLGKIEKRLNKYRVGFWPSSWKIVRNTFSISMSTHHVPRRCQPPVRHSSTPCRPAVLHRLLAP